jgi:hypothetical protein
LKLIQRSPQGGLCCFITTEANSAIADDNSNPGITAGNALNVDPDQYDVYKPSGIPSDATNMTATIIYSVNDDGTIDAGVSFTYQYTDTDGITNTVRSGTTSVGEFTNLGDIPGLLDDTENAENTAVTKEMLEMNEFGDHVILTTDEINYLQDSEPNALYEAVGQEGVKTDRIA